MTCPRFNITTIYPYFKENFKGDGFNTHFEQNILTPHLLQLSIYAQILKIKKMCEFKHYNFFLNHNKDNSRRRCI